MANRTKTRRVTFVPAEDFTGYPFGHRTEFKTGQRSIPVAESFADLMREKGHVEPGKPFVPVKEDEAE